MVWHIEYPDERIRVNVAPPWGGAVPSQTRPGDTPGIQRSDVWGTSLAAQLGRTLAWVAACAVLALPFFPPGGRLSLVRVAMQQSASIRIDGSVADLQPARSGVPTLTLHNGSDAEVGVHTLTAAVTGALGCAAGALTIRPWVGALTVAARRTATAALAVQLAVGHACPGATWQLRYTSS
ncbi:MAG: hypothetical protein NVS3B26_09590 [Mycobacteriales bacterium]